MIFGTMYRVEQRLRGDSNERAWMEQVETDVFDLALDVYDTVREVSDMKKDFEFRLVQRIEFELEISIVSTDASYKQPVYFDTVLSEK
jgi:hypothetical protein